MDRFYGNRCLASPGKDATHYHASDSGCIRVNVIVTTTTRAEKRGLRPHNCYHPDPIDIHSTDGIGRGR